MSHELTMLVATAALCLLQVIPYAVAYFRHWGVLAVLGNRSAPAELPEWANRAVRAHHNMLENLTHFAILVVAIELSGRNNATTALAVDIFFYARLAFVPVYILGIPWLRSALFATGVGAEVVLLLQLF